MTWQSIPEAFSTRLRVAIVGQLVRGPMDYVHLRAATGASDGNLASQLRRLETQGYLTCQKRFVGRQPRTEYQLTPQAAEAYRAYLTLLIRAIVPDEAKKEQ